jgi:hypothetical protein
MRETERGRCRLRNEVTLNCFDGCAHAIGSSYKYFHEKTIGLLGPFLERLCFLPQYILQACSTRSVCLFLCSVPGFGYNRVSPDWLKSD